LKMAMAMNRLFGRFMNVRQNVLSSMKLSSLSESELQDIGRERICHGVGRMTELVLERGEGSYVYTTEGAKYLDMTCGIGVTNTGHCHPRVVKAAQDQMGKLMHGQVNIAFQKPMIELCDKLAKKVMPFDLDTFFFWNSGSEAVESAIKLARHATGKSNILVFQGGYHGRTIGAMSLTTSKTIYRAGYSPLMSGVSVTPFPYTYQFKNWISNTKDNNSLSKDELDDICMKYCLEQLRLVLCQQADPKEVAAMIIEPVQGEGGYVVPPKEFLKALRAICDEHGILLIADEVQSGFGRTGKFFAMEHFDTRPDILIFAKGLASGMPLSGIASTRKLMDTQPAGSQGGTYAGNAVACAAASATVDVIIEEDLLTNTQVRGDEMMSGLRAILEKHSVTHDVRGLGLMIGCEFSGRKKGVAGAVSKGCLERGMLLLTTGVFETLRFIPPLNITTQEVQAALTIFDQALEQAIADGY